MPFSFEHLSMSDVIHIQPKQFSDERGMFCELFKSSDFMQYGLPSFKQVNFSFSKKNVLRGLHYQVSPSDQGKLVSVVKGVIYDVAVDIRKESAHYGQWLSVELSSEKKNMLYIPEGFAHGFCVLSEEAEVIYYCSKEYDPSCEKGIIWNDPNLKISWPISDPLVSDKDAKY